MNYITLRGLENLCMYANDAGTLVGVRPGKGCDLKTERNLAGDLSTCSGVGVRTLAQMERDNDRNVGSEYRP